MKTLWMIVDRDTLQPMTYYWYRSRASARQRIESEGLQRRCKPQKFVVAGGKR